MICSFCNNEISPGTGILYVKKDGSTMSFCGGKCKANLLELGREGRRTKWTNKALVTRTGKAEGSDAKKSELSSGIDKMLAEKRAAEKKPAEKK